jgi:hypothetical protein
MSSERELRALRRRNWPGGLSTEHRAAQLDTAEERLATMWQLALDAWSLSGEPLPVYERETMPGRLIRPS